MMVHSMEPYLSRTRRLTSTDLVADGWDSKWASKAGSRTFHGRATAPLRGSVETSKTLMSPLPITPSAQPWLCPRHLLRARKGQGAACRVEGEAVADSGIVHREPQCRVADQEEERVDVTVGPEVGVVRLGELASLHQEAHGLTGRGGHSGGVQRALHVCRGCIPAEAGRGGRVVGDGVLLGRPNVGEAGIGNDDALHLEDERSSDGTVGDVEDVKLVTVAWTNFLAVSQEVVVRGVDGKLGKVAWRGAGVVAGHASVIVTIGVVVRQEGDDPHVRAVVSIDRRSRDFHVADVRQSLELLLHAGAIATTFRGGREGVVSDRGVRRQAEGPTQGRRALDKLVHVAARRDARGGEERPSVACDGVEVPNVSSPSDGVLVAVVSHPHVRPGSRRAFPVADAFHRPVQNGGVSMLAGVERHPPFIAAHLRATHERRSVLERVGAASDNDSRRGYGNEGIQLILDLLSRGVVGDGAGGVGAVAQAEGALHRSALDKLVDLHEGASPRGGAKVDGHRIDVPPDVLMLEGDVIAVAQLQGVAGASTDGHRGDTGEDVRVDRTHEVVGRERQEISRVLHVHRRAQTCVAQCVRATDLVAVSGDARVVRQGARVCSALKGVLHDARRVFVSHLERACESVDAGVGDTQSRDVARVGIKRDRPSVFARPATRRQVIGIRRPRDGKRAEDGGSAAIHQRFENGLHPSGRRVPRDLAVAGGVRSRRPQVLVRILRRDVEVATQQRPRRVLRNYAAHANIPSQRGAEQRCVADHVEGVSWLKVERDRPSVASLRRDSKARQRSPGHVDGASRAVDVVERGEPSVQ
eukprot:scaffold1102_cov256-Pinguiococcus_pyrenoidosus.AAC.9